MLGADANVMARGPTADGCIDATDAKRPSDAPIVMYDGPDELACEASDNGIR